MAETFAAPVYIRGFVRTYAKALKLDVAQLSEALEAESFWKHMPFARSPEVIVLSPDQIETVVDATDLLVDQQDVTPLGLAYQAIELQTTADPLDVALKRVLRAMKV